MRAKFPSQATNEYIQTNYIYDPAKCLIYKKQPDGSLKKFNITYNAKGYVKFWFSLNEKRICLYYHRVVWFLVFGYWPVELDHANGDKSDNRLENLRLSTRSQNMQNVGKFHINVSSKYKGVSWHARSGKWQAAISCKDQRYHIGVFVSEVKAAKAYDAKAIELFGEFANTNFPQNKE